MNINDVEIPQERPCDLLGAIFDRQTELAHKYHGIEKANGLLISESIPVDIHCRFGQARLKDFAWRMTEEFTEATESIHNREHYLEELIDGFHFFVELCILAGWRPGNKLEVYFELGRILFIKPYDIIEEVGLAMNCLKNKPWKNTHMLTDENKFYYHLNKAWNNFISLLNQEGLTASDVYDLYFRKSSVNFFRIRSKY